MLAGDPILEIFFVRSASGAVIVPDTLPTAVLVRNGIDTTVPVVVTARVDGSYSAATASLSTWQHGDVLHLRVQAVVLTVPLVFTARVGVINDANRPVIVFTGSSNANISNPNLTANSNANLFYHRTLHKVYFGDRWLFTITLKQDLQVVSIASGSSVIVVFESIDTRVKTQFIALEVMPTANWAEGVVGLEIMPNASLAVGLYRILGVRVGSTTYEVTQDASVLPSIV